MRVLYTATATGGREGHVSSSDGILDLPLARPKELGGSGRAATNPEQLFAAGYAACFEQAVLRAAEERKVTIFARDRRQRRREGSGRSRKPLVSPSARRTRARRALGPSGGIRCGWR